MNANRQFDEDDLVLYAMRLLAEPEHSEAAAFVAATPAAQQRVAELQSLLGAYAQAAVEPQPLPAGSLDRLLARVEREPKTASLPAASTKKAEPRVDRTGPSLVPTPPALSTSSSADDQGFRSTGRSSLLWTAGLGWAMAALLAIAAGLALKQRSSLRDALNSRDTQVAALSSDAETLRRERETLRTDLSAQQQRLATSSSELTATQTHAAALRDEAEKARSSAANLQANLSGEKARGDAEKARGDTEQARAAAAEQERNRLQGTLAAQAAQLAALQTTTSNAEALATLTDPTALRVVLTQPKAKPAPTGRAAYVVDKGSLVFLANNLEPLQPNKVYELWLLPASGANPVPAGTFVPDARGDAHVVYARFPQAVPAKGFAVTIENAGGATTPTMPLILAGL